MLKKVSGFPDSGICSKDKEVPLEAQMHPASQNSYTLCEVRMSRIRSKLQKTVDRIQRFTGCPAPSCSDRWNREKLSHNGWTLSGICHETLSF
jgi:hypothetical protein